MCRYFCVTCSPAAQSSVIELLEESGLPPICVAIADASNADVTLGKVLVAAVKVRCSPDSCDGFRPFKSWGLGLQSTPTTAQILHNITIYSCWADLRGLACVELVPGLP